MFFPLTLYTVLVGLRSVWLIGTDARGAFQYGYIIAVIVIVIVITIGRHRGFVVRLCEWLIIIVDTVSTTRMER